MKKLILNIGFLLLSLMIYSQTYTVSITGIVSDMYTGAPIPQQEMNLSTDSISGGTSYYNTVYTDDYGVYYDSFAAQSGETGTVIITTFSCGMVYTSTAEFSENNSQLIVDMQICGDTIGDCQAMFSYYPTGDLSIQFQDISIGNPNQWIWEFGDGVTSNEQNPLHTYSDYGPYYVTLTISNDSTQCASIAYQMVYVGDTIYPPECQASWWAYPDSSNLYTIYFQDLSIPAGGITSWSWSFGDGTGSYEQNPVHSYNAPGYYDVCLTVSDSSGTCQDTYCAEMYVGDWQPDCEAYYYYYPTDTMGSGWSFNNIQFIDASIGNPDSWYWEFGDGQTSNEQNPVHYFNDQGLYEVCLTISNSGDSCISTFCDYIEIYNDTLPGCITWFDYTINDLEVDFEAFTEGMQGDTEYFWSFGDSTTATGLLVSHTYTESGYYFVTLTASSAGCTSTYAEMIWVGELSFDVMGYVYLEDSMQMADFANVHLMTFDTVGYGLIQVETTQVDANGQYLFEAVAMENCVYFVQAELSSQSAYFGQYLPTYHFDALNWENAWPVFPFPMNWTYDIYMINSSSSSSGMGIITGTVNSQSTRGVMEDVEMLLYDHMDNPLSYIRTDESGKFDFGNLELGTYKIQTEMVGVNSEPIEVTLTNDQNTVDISIVVYDGEAILGIEDPQSAYFESISEVFPNPVTHNSNLIIELKESTSVNIDIYNQYGQKCGTQAHNLNTGSNEIVIKSNSLAEGMYFIRISSSDETSLTRKFVKLR